ncbi:MAG: polysaccharide deacetylase family protein [Ethanoligenens sp.]
MPVLMYHSISIQAGNNLCIPPALFASEMDWLQANGYTTLSMDELYAHVNAHTALPDKVVVITLDDGYFDNYTNAYPVLKKDGLKATVFMISGKIGTSNYMVASQLKEMSQNGIDIEDHTVTHGYLSKMTYSQQVAELQDSKASLEQITGKPVLYVAYPYGDYNANTLRAAQAIGYKLGFLEDGGTAAVTDPQLEIRRSYVSAKDDLNAFIKIVQAK